MRTIIIAILFFPTFIIAQKTKFGLKTSYIETYRGNFSNNQNEVFRILKIPSDFSKTICFGINYASIGSSLEKRLFLKHGLEGMFPLRLQEAKYSRVNKKNAFYLNNLIGLRAIKNESLILQIQLENKFLVSSNTPIFGDFTKLNRSFWNIGVALHPLPIKSSFSIYYDFSFTPIGNTLTTPFTSKVFYSSLGLAYSI